MSGVKLADLLAETIAASLVVGSETVGLRLRVFPTDIPSDEWDRLKQDTTPVRDFYLAVLPRELEGWEIEQDGEPLPVTAEAIDAAAMPTSLLKSVYERVLAAREAGKGSNGTSPEPSTPAGAAAS